MKICFVSAVFAVILPYSSSFRVHVQRCTQLQSSWILRASGSSISESDSSNVQLKRKSLFTRRTAATSIDKPDEANIVIDTKVVIDYDNMTVLGLKEVLRERGLQVSGLKEELKIRLKLDDSKNQPVVSKSAKAKAEADDLDYGVFSSSEKDFLQNLPGPGLRPEVESTNSWVKSSSETAFNDRKFKDQQIQEEQKNIVRGSVVLYLLIFS